MAITRRQFVTRLGALAAATGLSQTQLLKLTEALAHDGTSSWLTKPKVVWVHGAECTGCSTSLLGLFEDVRGRSVEDKRLTASVVNPNDPTFGTDETYLSTLAALDYAVGGDGDGGNVLGPYAVAALAGAGVNLDGVTVGGRTGHPDGHRTLWEQVDPAGAGMCLDVDAAANPISGGPLDGVPTPFIANIADVLIDFISLEYHETVMGMGGDLAYQELKKWRDGDYGNGFVLVVEGAVQPSDQGGAWDKDGEAAWCGIGMGTNGGEHKFDEVVSDLAQRAGVIIPIGQCACFGGYPGCVSPVTATRADGTEAYTKMSQSGALGVYDYLMAAVEDGGVTADKVVNVPGCPTNPWWFVLTVVLYLVATVNGLEDALLVTDDQRRLKAVYGMPIHGFHCPRYVYRFPNNPAGAAVKYAEYPGDVGCLAMLGCKGISTNSLCAAHGWNGQQPENDSSWDQGIATVNGDSSGGFCVAGGAPCMGCAERGYPDSYVPFIKRG